MRRGRRVVTVSLGKLLCDSVFYAFSLFNVLVPDHPVLFED
jgi:hypothetical protein